MRDVRKMWIVIVMLALLASLSAAQEADPNKPAGPNPSLDASDSSSKDDGGEKMLPDSNPLTGIQLPTLGHSSRMRSFFQPSFSFSQAMDTNATYSSGPAMRDYISSFGGGLSMDRRGEHQQYQLEYAGGATIYQIND